MIETDRMETVKGGARLLALVAWVTAIGGFLFGYDTAVINGANQYLKAHFSLNATAEGLAGASAILGCIPGAMFAGFFSDRWGRRKVLFACAVLYAASGLLSAIPRTFTEFLAARFISGLGIGASSMICPIYIAELAPARNRGRLGALFQLGIVTGIFLTLLINAQIQGLGDEAWNAAYGWRWMLAAEVIPAIALASLLFVAPESPRWLISVARDGDAHKILTRLGGEEHAQTEIAAVREVLQQGEGRFAELLSPLVRRPLLVAVVLMAVSQLCGINAVIYYSTKIFATAGSGVQASFRASMVMGFVNLIFTIVALVWVDRLGRRPLLVMGLAVQVMTLAITGWMFHTAQNGVVLMVAILSYTAAFAMALGPVGWIICSEIFPTRVRGRAMSIAAFTVWLTCYIVAQTFPMLNDHPAIGPAKTFWVYGAVSLFGLLFVFFKVPETKGKTLEQIETFWHR